MRVNTDGLKSKPEQPTSSPCLSVILPALRADAEYLRCVDSLRAVLADKLSYEIISIVRDFETFSGLEASDLHILREPSHGIYAAMNAGLDCANGTYIYFIGQDDIFLPEALGAIDKGLRHNADVILANVFWGRGEIFKNPSSPRSLIWRNWCHQGIIYRLDLFRKTEMHFPQAFKAQADHYVNIVMTAKDGAKIVKHNGCIAWYSANGFSCKSIDGAFRAQFPSLIREHFGFRSFVIVVLRRALLKIAKMVFH